MRNTLQNSIKNDTLSILEKNNNVLFSEIKTGTGKTKILLDVAFERLKKTNKSIIISTSNNFLTLEFLKEAEKFGYNKEQISILIGKDNYVNFDMIDETFCKTFSLDLQSVKEWKENNINYPLISLFMEYFNLPEEAETIISTEREDDLTINEKTAIVADNPMIYITNHYYLIYMLMFSKIEDFFLIDIYVDEVHLLNQAAKTLYRKSFSPFRLTFLLKKLMLDDKRGKNKYFRLIRILENLMDDCKIFNKKNIDDNLIQLTVEKLHKLLESDYYKDAKKQILQKLKKRKDKNFNMTLNEMYEAEAIARSRYVDISFSPVKANITYTTNEENPINRLKSIFSKHSGNFWGVSGTLRVVASDSMVENKWSFERIGFFKFKEPADEKQYRFNLRINNIIFKVYQSIFSKKQAVYYIADDEKYLPIKDIKQKSFEKKYKKWVYNLSLLVKDMFWGNGLILMSSFENVELMKNNLVDNGFAEEYLIFANTVGTNTRKLITEYKKAVDNGKKAVLIGGLNFYTGIDLSGNYLNTLFVGKLPIEPKSNFFTRMKFGSFSVQAELRKTALLMFRQGLGRAIRSLEDRAFIIIADPRIKNGRYGVFKDFLDEMAIEKKFNFKGE